MIHWHFHVSYFEFTFLFSVIIMKKTSSCQLSRARRRNWRRRRSKERSREKVGGHRLPAQNVCFHSVPSDLTPFRSSPVGVELEMGEVTNRSHSDSKDHLTPELQDPAPQKKRKKKKSPHIGRRLWLSFDSSQRMQTQGFVHRRRSSWVHREFKELIKGL